MGSGRFRRISGIRAGLEDMSQRFVKLELGFELF